MARDPYEVVLADLRAKRDDIDRLIRSLEAFRPAQTPPVQSTAPALSLVLENPPYRGKSIVDAAYEALKTNEGPMGTAEIAKSIQDGGLVMNSVEPANTVSSVLHRAYQAGGNVVKVGRGRWGLAEWYPGQILSPHATQIAASTGDVIEGEKATDNADPKPSHEDEFG